MKKILMIAGGTAVFAIALTVNPYTWVIGILIYDLTVGIPSNGGLW